MPALPSVRLRPFDGSEEDRAGLSEVVAGAFTLDRWVTDPLFVGRPLGPMFAAGALEAAEAACEHPERYFCFVAETEPPAPAVPGAMPAGEGATHPRVVGVCLGYLEENLLDFTGVPVGTLWSLAVAEAWRRQGLGRRLFDAAQGWMRAAGCRQLNVSTDDGNPANELYRTAGCQPVHVLRTWSLPLEGP